MRCCFGLSVSLSVFAALGSSQILLRHNWRERGRQAGETHRLTDREREGGWDEILGFDDEERKGESESLY